MKINLKILFLIIIIFIIDETYPSRSILLIICYDGFRNDYLDRGITPNLINFRDNGISAKYLKTVYPALAIPSLHTIATGLYPQNHGIKMRNYTSPDGATQYDPKTSEEAYTQNYTVPIWVLNQKNGGTSACIMWPGTEATFNGTKCNYVMKFDRTKKLKERADQMITYLEDDVKINLVMFYIEELDRITHFFGILSRNTTMIIRRVDLLTRYIIAQLIQKDLYYRTNIIILSDHGMQSTSNDKIVPEPDRKFMAGDPSFTFENAIDDVNAIISLQILNQYISNYTFEVGEFWTLARQKNLMEIVRIPPGINGTMAQIEYAACPGFIFDLTRWKTEAYAETYKTLYKDLEDPSKLYFINAFGAHGYPRENDAMFMAKGPQFVMNRQIEPIEMVDLYSAFTRLLNIQGSYEHDGNYSRVFPLFPIHRKINWIGLLVTIAILAIISCLLFFCIVKYIVAATLPDGFTLREINRDVKHTKPR